MDLGIDQTTADGLHRYVGQVADALALTGNPYCLDLARPMNAYLALDTRLPSFPHCDTALLWDERYGWAGTLETDARSELTVLTYLGGDVLPSPRTVARFGFAFVADRLPRHGSAPELADTGHDELLRRLARYSQPIPLDAIR